MSYLLFNPNYKKVPKFVEHTYYENVTVKSGRCECNKKETKDVLLKSGYQLIEEKKPIRVPTEVGIASDGFSLSALEKMSWLKLRDVYLEVTGEKPKVGMSKIKLITEILEKQN